MILTQKEKDFVKYVIDLSNQIDEQNKCIDKINWALRALNSEKGRFIPVVIDQNINFNVSDPENKKLLADLLEHQLRKHQNILINALNKFRQLT